MTNEEKVVVLSMWERALPPFDEIYATGKHVFGQSQTGFTLTVVSLAGNVFENYQCLVLTNMNSEIDPRNESMELLGVTIEKSSIRQGPPTLMPQAPILIFLSDANKPTNVLRGAIRKLPSGETLAWFRESKWKRFDPGGSRWTEVEGFS